MKRINIALAIVAIALILSGIIIGTRLGFESIGKTYGYIGIFAMSFISCTTIILPVPYAIPLITIAATTGLHPLLIGIIGGTGAALGEFSGYILGRSSSEALYDRIKHRLEWAISFFEKHGFIAIFLVNVTPLPVGVLYIVAGMAKYSIKKILIGGIIGKVLLVTGLAYLGNRTARIIEKAPESPWKNVIFVIIGLVIALYLLGGGKWIKEKIFSIDTSTQSSENKKKEKK